MKSRRMIVGTREYRQRVYRDNRNVFTFCSENYKKRIAVLLLRKLLRVKLLIILLLRVRAVVVVFKV